MRIELCFHGLIGGVRGKNMEVNPAFSTEDGGSATVLGTSYKHNKKNIINCNENIDVFVHSWSYDIENEINNLYKPKLMLAEKQIMFKVPDYIRSSSKRAFAHFSRWYSFKKVVELKRQYEIDNNIIYDFVLVQRFDLLWNIQVLFDNLKKDIFYIGNSKLNPKVEISDRWFISNSKDMDRFSMLYDLIPEYMLPGRFDSSKQWSGISRHSLCRYHLEQLGIEEEIKFNYGPPAGSLPNDFNSVEPMLST